MLKKVYLRLLPTLDIISTPFVFTAALFLKAIREIGLYRLPAARGALKAAGLLPIRRHYFEPLVYPEDLRFPLDRPRSISGLDMNVEEQLKLLESFRYQAELEAFPRVKRGENQYYYRNGSFEAGDAQFLYSMIRRFKPKRIVEVGSGFSTLLAGQAVRKNAEADSNYRCRMTCIEPFEYPWLEDIGVAIERELVERCDPKVFDDLGKEDFLFIDSSHVIRPQGDVLYLYQEVLGRLKSGVIVHAHDINTPRDYPEKMVLENQLLWNEQYLLESFLSFNRDFRVIGAVNYLWHDHADAFAEALPARREWPDFEPGSFWFARD
jgi:predicted O-methyltransferase YrrM